MEYGMLDIDKIKSVLIDRDIKTTEIERATGISRPTISHYRNNIVKFENIRLETLLKLDKFIKDNDL